jgi:hypothetical protein
MKVRRNFKRWRAIALMAIVKMQAVGRGRLARKLYGSMQEKRRNQCAVKIQRVILGVLYVPRSALHRHVDALPRLTTLVCLGAVLQGAHARRAHPSHSEPPRRKVDPNRRAQQDRPRPRQRDALPAVAG